MSEEKKQKLKEYQKKYREAKKSKYLINLFFLKLQPLSKY